MSSLLWGCLPIAFDRKPQPLLSCSCLLAFNEASHDLWPSPFTVAALIAWLAGITTIIPYALWHTGGTEAAGGGRTETKQTKDWVITHTHTYTPITSGILSNIVITCIDILLCSVSEDRGNICALTWQAVHTSASKFNSAGGWLQASFCYLHNTYTTVWS